MEIILKKDVANLGHADDIVNVKTGYAVNYLIPQGYAIMATASAKKVLAENLRQRAHKIAKFTADAEALAAKLAETVVKVSAKVSSDPAACGASIYSSGFCALVIFLQWEIRRFLMTMPAKVGKAAPPSSRYFWAAWQSASQPI